MDGALEAFAAEVRRPEGKLRLDRAALLIAAAEYPNLSIATSLALLDEIAAGVAAAIRPDASPRVRAAAVRRRLFRELDFHGNEREYYDPRNSYLNYVLLRRVGIPISLSVVFLEVARRVGLEAEGVSYPRHFLVKYRDGDREWFVDPFNRGQEFPGEPLRAVLAGRGTTPPHLIDYYLAGVTHRQILLRMLANLKAIYTRQEDHARALRVQEFTLALTPWSLPDIRDRGLLRARLGDVAGALADLETYLTYEGEAEDAPAVRRLRDDLRADRPPRDDSLQRHGDEGDD